MIREKKQKLPRWMKAQFPSGTKYTKIKNLINEKNLHTICTSGNCPNKGECWNAGTASFMILGENCTRNCRFCAVKNLIPQNVDWEEPRKLAETIQALDLKHCVITSVARDDLNDGGARFWAKTIEMVKKDNPDTSIEALIPDFNGDLECLDIVIQSKPEVISHNMETVRRITPQIRGTARYDRSLRVLKRIADSGLIAKSGIMAGLGETEKEVLETMRDLRDVDVKVMTIGQYLQPSSHHVAVKEYVKPEVFEKYKQAGLDMGFSYVESSALVRSSYHAERHIWA